MNPCGLNFGMDIGACISSMATGWLPDWLVPLLPYWPLAAVVVGAGIAWRFAGAPGLAAFAAAVGYILGRRSVPLVVESGIWYCSGERLEPNTDRCGAQADQIRTVTGWGESRTNS